MSKISFIKSDDRNYNIERCLSLIKGEIISGLKHAKNIVVRPNCPTDYDKLSSTSLESLETVLKFIHPYAKSQITLAEGTIYGNTLEAFKQFGYLSLQEEYDLTLVDLNNDEYENIALLDKNGQEIVVKIAKTILNSDYLITIAIPSTDELAVFSGIIKSVAMSSIIKVDYSIATKFSSKIGIKKNDKFVINQGNYYTNDNIKNIYNKLPIKLSILDGFELITGNGPINGEMVPGHFAISSSDPFAADWLSSQILNIDLDSIGYLKMIDVEDTNKSDYFIIGDNWQKNLINIKMHKNYSKIKNWHQK